MKVGQIIIIISSNVKGRITFIDDFDIDIDWMKEDGSLRYNEPVRYGLPHINSLITQETIYVRSDELPKGDPNLSFKVRESE